MTVTTATPPTGGAGDTGAHRELGPVLARTRLPATVFGVIGAVVIAVSLALFSLTGLAGRIDFVLFAAALYLVVATTVSVVAEGSRIARDRLATTLVYACFAIALVPLIAVLAYVVSKGLHRFDGTLFTHSTRNVDPSDRGGGIYHAIIGTLEQVLLASLMAVPLALLCAVFLVEYSSPRWLARAVSFFIDVLTGLPSIVAGLFVYALWILVLGFGYSGFAGSLALAILMLPIVVRSSEQMLLLVPNTLRESSYALGVPKWKTILRIVVPTALPGMVTGILLALARVVGETAPVLLLVFSTDRINTNPFKGAQEPLSLFVFNNATLPNQPAIDRAWSAALTLILIVLILNLIARVATRASRIS